MRSVEIGRWVMGPLKTNCYMVRSGEEVILIDVGFPREALEVAELLLERGWIPKYIVATHGHFDHVMGVDAIRRRLKREIPLYVHIADVELLARAGEALKKYFGIEMDPPRPNHLLEDGEILRVGELEIQVIHLPGHTPGSIALYIPSEDIVFTGDTLFRRYVGRCDFPESSCRDLANSLRRLFQLPPQTRVYPGHMEETILGEEMFINPYVKELLDRY